MRQAKGARVSLTRASGAWGMGPSSVSCPNLAYPDKRLLKKSVHQEATGRDAAQNDG